MNNTIISMIEQVIPEDACLLPMASAIELSGLTRDAFNQHIRPHLTLIKRGRRSVGVLPSELKLGLENYFYDHRLENGDLLWLTKHLRESPCDNLANLKNVGTSTKQSTANGLKQHLSAIAGIT